MPNLLRPYLLWAQSNIDQRLNGMLLNWYDGQCGHYIGSHRDSTKGLIDNSVIVMVSLGGIRVTRFRPLRGSGYQDIEVGNGDVLVMDLQTNQHYKHEIPKSKRYLDKRISITLRCFDN